MSLRRLFLASLAFASIVYAPTACAPARHAVAATTDAAPLPSSCHDCPVWNAPQAPFRVYGNTYWVGPHGLGSILVTSPQGHVLIDGALPESAGEIMARIRELGFRVEDVKLILNSHVHYDHAGGIGAIQRASGAVVAASPRSAPVLERGRVGNDDPQYGLQIPMAAVRNVRVIRDGETLRVGPLALTAHFTPGHTPGGTTWTWISCGGGRCLHMVYADSQTPVSADDFYFTHNATYLTAVADFRHSEAVLDSLPCDILMTTHPGVSNFWARVAARDSGDASALIDPQACRRLAAASRTSLAQRIAKEDSARALGH
jgi:metallo-beta-lactamase class B